MSPLIKELRKKFKVKLCITAQHREMLDEVLDIFKIKPSYDLNIMKKNQDLFYLNSQIILNIKKILIKEKPSLVMVHGDTSTAFVSSLAAFYLNIPIAHVEAGLRTYNMRSPFPEEFNRQIIDKLSSS